MSGESEPAEGVFFFFDRRAPGKQGPSTQKVAFSGLPHKKRLGTRKPREAARAGKAGAFHAKREGSERESRTSIPLASASEPGVTWATM